MVYLAATVANAGEIVRGLPPTSLGVGMSALYLLGWLGFAVVTGCRPGSAALRRTSVVWAVLVAGSAVGGSLLRGGRASSLPGGDVGAGLLVVVAAPLYGLAGLLATDTAAALVAVTVVVAALTMALALVTRRRHRLRLVRRAQEAEGNRRADQSSAGLVPEPGA